MQIRSPGLNRFAPHISRFTCVGQVVGVTHKGIQGIHRPAFFGRQEQEAGMEARACLAAQLPTEDVACFDGVLRAIHGAFHQHATNNWIFFSLETVGRRDQTS